jgi:alkanesulfonate monooxygenase SsuD/methylene tetrahydromethanopterin reductase-like flavin-dependent oxidoreductase (luciferase family)
LKLVLMIEGQEGVTWPDWLTLADAAESHGFEALLRSDHYRSVDDRPERGGALDAWGTICALAVVTERVRLGTLVSPVTFRAPAVLAKLALTADHISGGRIDVGFGTGWWEAEHREFGFEFPPIGERMDELERQLAEVQRLWRETGPPPVQQPRPHVIVGGGAKPRGARLAARYADEYNVHAETPAAVRERRAALDRACEAEGRDPATLALSLMTGFVIGADEADLRARRARMADWRGRDDIPESWLHGTVEQVRERLREYADAGVDRVMFQHHVFRDLEVVELIGTLRDA